MINNFKNQIVKNIFTKEEIELIYDHMNSAPPTALVLHHTLGQKMFMWGMPDLIKEKVLEIAQKYSSVPLKLTEISAARYANGYLSIPKLYPHVDFFEEPRFTFDIQLKSTRNWPIVVEGQEFVLRDNDAVIFSGTNQLHWRPKMIFNHDDIIDMLFCHFSEDSEAPELNSQEFKKEISEREEEFKKMYDEDMLEDYYKNRV